MKAWVPFIMLTGSWIQNESHTRVQLMNTFSKCIKKIFCKGMEENMRVSGSMTVRTLSEHHLKDKVIV